MDEEDLNLFREYRKTGDRAIRNKLVDKYMPTASIIAKKFVGRGVDYDDLLQVASEGLIAGIEKYDPDSCNEFSTYITPTITGMIKNYFRDAAKPIRLPRKLYAVSKRIKQCNEAYLKTHDRKPSVRQLSEMLGVSEDLIIQAMEFQTPVSLDSPIIAESEDTDSPTYESIAVDETPYENFENNLALKREISKLSEREQKIVKMRFKDGKSQAETGKALGLSQMFISRLEKRIIEKLKDALTQS